MPLKIVAAILSALPRSGVLAVGRGLGWFMRVVLRFRRAHLFESLHRCFPEKSETEIRTIARDAYVHFCTTAVEIVRLMHAPPKSPEGFIKVEGLEHGLAAVAQGRGVLILMGHIGNWELMGYAVSQLGHEMHAVVKHLHSKQMDALTRRMRERMGLRLLPAGAASFRQCLRVLRNGGNVAMIMDQNMIRRESVFVNFFGKPAATTPGLAVLAAQSQAPVLPAYITRQKDGSHTVTICPAIPPPTGRTPEAIKAATQTYNDILEANIRQNPAQWIWFHRRWKTTEIPAEGEVY